MVGNLDRLYTNLNQLAHYPEIAMLERLASC